MPRRSIAYLLVVVALLGGMAFAMVTTALQQSPTIDEPVYVATAEVLTQQHSVRYNPEHPPLGKLVMAAGLAFGDAELDPAYTGNQTQLGRHLLYETGNNPFRLMLLARLPMIVLTILIGLVVLGFARDLAGPWAGLVALALYAFSPDVIAHGSLATLDVPAAGMLLTCFWMLWRSRDRPRLYLPLAGLALGAALATRMSTLPAVPIVVALALLSPAVAGRSSKWWRELLMRALGAIGVGLIAVAVVWLVYLAVDPRLRWTTPVGVTNPGGLKGLAVDLLPLPKAYRDGVLIQFRFEARNFNGFLLGRAYRGSLWYYLPVALLIKTPLGMLAMWLAGVVTMLVRPALRIATLYLLLPAAALMLIAMTGARDYGTRYVIFMPIFLAVVSGTVVLIRWRFARVGVAALVAFVAVSSMLTFPYYLPYSNEAFGGTAKTHLNLHDANVDWGQDLGRLGNRLREKYPNETVWLVYKGSGAPGYYGIQGRNPLATTVALGDVHGLLVVSDSRVALAKGKLKQLIDSSTEIDNVGYSIRIYRR
ncbi:glycosyltransferase family 39 protein [Actinoplanes sp. NPDC026619]|uniref:ArnT family glycosyltransferase n=1 Tax=Actinoplanes sp. NPDC026619 TaxID=3155798 RepID=UPI0033FE7F88